MRSKVWLVYVHPELRPGDDAAIKVLLLDEDPRVSIEDEVVVRRSRHLPDGALYVFDGVALQARGRFVPSFARPHMQGARRGEAGRLTVDSFRHEWETVWAKVPFKEPGDPVVILDMAKLMIVHAQRASGNTLFDPEPDSSMVGPEDLGEPFAAATLELRIARTERGIVEGWRIATVEGTGPFVDSLPPEVM